MSSMRGQFTRAEILSQPQAWEDALITLRQQRDSLKVFLRQTAYDSVIFTGCGSTYYLSLAAAALMQELNDVYARALPASEIWLYPRSSFRRSTRTLLIAVSRSGETTETLHAVEQFRAEGNGHVLSLSCYGDKPLAQTGEINLVLPSGQEQSIAQTRAFSVLYLATVYIAVLWRGDEGLLAEMERLPEVCHAVLEQYGESARRWGENLSIERFYFLGSAPRYGLACELSLKMKEMSLSHSEPFHFMEFRHGPQSMVTADTLIVGLVSSANQASEQTVLDEMRQRGAHSLSIGNNNTEMAFASSVSEAVRNVLYLPIGQLLAYERSMARGLDPDRPHNLEAVVRLGGQG